MPTLTKGKEREHIAELLEESMRSLTHEQLKDVRFFANEAASAAKALQNATNGRVKIEPVTVRADGVEGGPRFSQSLERGMLIWSLFAEQQVWTLADIADRLKLARSTTHRYLATLKAMGLVESTVGRRYRRIDD
jgi:DNA-binding transcriptional ArsR family regulator